MGKDNAKLYFKYQWFRLVVWFSTILFFSAVFILQSNQSITTPDVTKTFVSTINTPVTITDTEHPDTKLTIIPDQNQNEPTDIPSSTPTITPTITSTATLTPTTTPTITPQNYSIKIGVFDLDLEITQEIISRLENKDFNVDKIRFSAKNLNDYQVLYLSYGWYSKRTEVEKIIPQLKQFMENGGGILIGNPEITREYYVFDFLRDSFTITYQKLNNEDGIPVDEYFDGANNTFLLFNLEKKEYPSPENRLILYFPGDPNEVPYQILVSGGNAKHISLVRSTNKDIRFVFMPGGELSTSLSQVSEDLLENIILYLAGELGD